jgi:hypothetical protein
MNTTTKFDATLLVPQPQRIRLHGGFCNLQALTHWCLYASPARASGLDHVIADINTVLGRPLRRADSAGENTLHFVIDGQGVPGRGDESYTLDLAPRSVTITAASMRAAFWAVQTLRQIVEVAGGLRVPALVVHDWPRFAFRGFSDDMSRRQISTVRDIEHTIQWLARFKVNVYQPYMEDIIFIDKHPQIGRGSGRFTRDEIAMLVACGRRHFVEIMPQFNSLSHQEHMLALPEYAGLRYKGNPENANPNNPNTRAWLRDVYQQLFAQFPCRYFHMGMDEARGLLDEPDLYIGLANWLAELVLGAGKTPIMWHDMFVPYHTTAVKYSATLLDRLNRGIILNQWLYRMPDARVRFLDEIVTRGFTALQSPWIQSHYCGASGEDWRMANALITYGQQFPRMLGVHNCTWNDNAIVTDRALNWRGHAMAAELGWRGAQSANHWQAVTRAFALQFHGVRDARAVGARDDIAEFGREQGGMCGRAAIALPVQLAHTCSDTDVRRAKQVYKEARALMQTMLEQDEAIRRNGAVRRHAFVGLARIAAGAMRMHDMPALCAALRRRNVPRIAALMQKHIVEIESLRQLHEGVYLEQFKAEGMEYLDAYYRQCIAAMQDLPWQVERHAARAHELMQQGWLPLDLRAAANSEPRDAAALLQGLVVWDNVPWQIIDPAANAGKALLWTHSAQFTTHPKTIVIPVNACARELHVLHATYGSHHAQPGSYRLEFADGTTRVIRLRAGKDVADWWNPLGHVLGGGGALRLDTRHCRLACMTGPEQQSNHGFYHFWQKVSTPRVPITRIVIEAGDEAVALVVPAMTLRRAR